MERCTYIFFDPSNGYPIYIEVSGCTEEECDRGFEHITTLQNPSKRLPLRLRVAFDLKRSGSYPG